MLMRNFIEQSRNNPGLVKAVIRQSGGWENFKAYAEDIVNHGVDAGFSGWIYYTETCPFFQKHRQSILKCAEDMAINLGEDMLSMINSFGCMRELELSLSELAQSLFTNKGELVTQVHNCMSWFIVEEVSRDYIDIVERN